MCDMNHKCNLTTNLVLDEDPAEQGIESPVSDIEMLSWELPTKHTDQPTLYPETQGHDTDPGPLNQTTEMCQSDRSQKKNGYERVLITDTSCRQDEQQSRESHTRQSCRKRRFRFFLAVVVTVFLVMLVVVLVVILKSHQAESSQPSVQALAGNYKIDADEGKCLCWKEDASCKEPYCYYENTDIAVLESLHQIPNNMDCPLDNAGCTGKLLTCNSLKSNRLRCLEDCDELKEQIIKNTYGCEETLKCCHALPCMTKLLNSAGNRSKKITSYFCETVNSHKIPKALCSPGWIGEKCDQPRNKNITCRCYKSKSNSFCVNYENCSEMMFVSNISSLCRKNNLTHCLKESKVCKSQYGGGDQCLCDIENKELADQDLCWRTEDPCREGYFNKTNGAITVPALERVHKIDQLSQDCDKIKEKTDEDLKGCNGNRIVDNYEMAEKLVLDKECVEVIKCCHVRNYGLKYFNVSGNGNHQIASVICKNYEEKTPPPIFQCQQGWRGDRCDETYQIQIGCRCFLSYGLCENTIDCSEVVYLNETMSLCSKHNLTHCESHVCRTRINDKECLCNVSTQWTQVSEMKSQSNLMNGAAILGQFTGIFARNILAIAIYFVLVHLHQSK